MNFKNRNSPNQAPQGQEEGDVPGEEPSLLLPSIGFYDRLECLRDLRTFAHAHRCNPDALLHRCLVRTAGFVPVDTRILSRPLKPSPLNLFAVCIGPSGSGKTDVGHPARLLAPAPAGLCEEVPLGSGEGITEYFLETRKLKNPSPDEGEKFLYVKQQVRFNLVGVVDEYEKLRKVGQRPGATIDSVLRTAFTGETLGEANARVETTRMVSEYAIGIMINMTPASLGHLASGEGYGTPQRFLFSSPTNPNIPDIPPRTAGIKPLNLRLPPGAKNQITFDPAIIREIDALILGIKRGQHLPHPLDAQLPVIRARVAGILAIWAGRGHVDPAIWGLAGAIIATSCRVRDHVLDRAREVEEERRCDAMVRKAEGAAKNRLAARGAVAAADRVAKRIGRLVQREGRAMKRREIQRGLGRDHFLLDEAVAVAVARRWAVPAAEDCWEPGPEPVPGMSNNV